ncbi:hypothetical protein EV424DRAFT_1363276 [Suillus variegatus]|nr:hypothetical protein EV424DRAFT_1363276 [Suillus variegatus]
MSQKPKGRPVRKIVSDHFVPVEKVKNNSNRYFFKCNYYLASIEGRDDNHLKHLIDQKTCPKAPDRTRADVGGYLATKKGNQDLLSPSIAETSSLSESQGPESITDEELREEFERFEREAREADQLRENDEGHVLDVLDGGIVDWSELERVE